MGTSNSYGGPGGGTPLIPSWLEPADDGPGAAPDTDDSTPPQRDPAPPPAVPPEPSRRPIPPAAPPSRFTAARNNLSRFASSGGHDRASLGRAVSHYVSSSAGGARQAAQRMGASRTTGARLLNFLTSAASGSRQALRALRLETLAGQPIQDIFLGLSDYICPDGGTVDEGIAREAFIETIADLAETGITDLDSLTPDQIQTICELYATNAIEARLCNDIGANVVTLPAGLHDAACVQSQLHDFIYRSVSDALTAGHAALQALTPDRVLGFVTRVYEQAFGILRTLGEAEAET